MPVPLSKMPVLPTEAVPEGRFGLPGAVNGLGLEGGLPRRLPVVPTGDVNALERACRPAVGLPAPVAPRPRPAELMVQSGNRKEVAPGQ
jgi:hypothetical protein